MEKVILKNIFNENVEVKIVDNQNDADFITHAGTFHADEVMATVILLNKFKSIKLSRVNTITNINAFSYDIGFGKFDHHGIDFDLKRENGIKYASCGLVWKEFGKDIVGSLNIKDKEAFIESVDKTLIMDIDRDDNGQKLVHEPEVKQQTIPSLIGSFNPSWNEKVSDNKKFLEALSFANTVFNNMVSKMLSKEAARDIVEKAISESKDGILVLDRYMPWKDLVLSSSNPKAKEIYYAVFPSKRGGYNIVGVPVQSGSFEVRKPFLESWGGLDEDKLKEVSGIKTIKFCHKGLFICACESLEDAIKIAKVSIASK